MKKIQKKIGYILLFPPLLSVILFTITLFVKEYNYIVRMSNMGPSWSGAYSYDAGGGYMSATPLYFGLMAIAGAYLIKDSKEE